MYHLRKMDLCRMAGNSIVLIYLYQLSISLLKIIVNIIIRYINDIDVIILIVHLFYNFLSIDNNYQSVQNIIDAQSIIYYQTYIILSLIYCLSALAIN